MVEFLLLSLSFLTLLMCGAKYSNNCHRVGLFINPQIYELSVLFAKLLMRGGSRTFKDFFGPPRHDFDLIFFSCCFGNLQTLLISAAGHENYLISCGSVDLKFINLNQQNFSLLSSKVELTLLIPFNNLLSFSLISLSSLYL